MNKLVAYQTFAVFLAILLTTLTVSALSTSSSNIASSGNIYYAPPGTTYTLTISSSVGGTTNPSGIITAEAGSIVVVTPIASAGYNFISWVLDGQDIGYYPTADIYMYSDRTLHAVFSDTTPTPSPTPSPTPPPNPDEDAAWDYITALIADYPNLTPFDMSRWAPTTWAGSGGANCWFYGDDNVLTPSGNPTWHGYPATSGNPYRELLCRDWPITPNAGDLIIMRFWARTTAPLYNIGVASSSILVFDMYPQNSGSQPDTPLGEVREHGLDARNSQGQYIQYLDRNGYDLSFVNQYAVHSLVLPNSIATHPETDGWVQYQLTAIVPEWNPNLVDYFGNQGAWEILTYYGRGWSPQAPYRHAPLFIGAQGMRDTGITMWLGDSEIYVISAGNYDPWAIGSIVDTAPIYNLP